MIIKFLIVILVASSLSFPFVFSHGFFENWGWLAGPLAWLGCAWVTARVVGLDPPPTLLRALGAGVVSALFVLIGLHWLGAVVAVGIFAYLCAREPGDRAWT